MSRKAVAPGIYHDSATASFLERPTINGKSTWRKIPARTLKDARAILSARRNDQARAAYGLARDPYAPPSLSVAELCAAYEKAGCPDRRDHPRLGDQLIHDIGRLKSLKKFFGARKADTLKPKDCNLYYAWRKARAKKSKDSGCTTDLELNTLSNVFHWAVSIGKLDSNPIVSRPSFYNTRNARRSYQRMPASVEELHLLAGHFFKSRQSEVLGWQILLQAMIGCRSAEIVKFRWDAKDRTEPGFIENGWVYLNRSKHGTKPFAEIHPALEECISELKRWHAWRQKKSRWWLPSPQGRGKTALSPSALAKGLWRCSEQVCGKRRTSHGFRAYYVTVRRSQNIGDGQIADELGDSSGASVVVRSYGGTPPNWRGAEGLTWLPKGKPAWEVLKMPENVVSLPITKIIKEK